MTDFKVGQHVTVKLSGGPKSEPSSKAPREAPASFVWQPNRPDLAVASRRKIALGGFSIGNGLICLLDWSQFGTRNVQSRLTVIRHDGAHHLTRRGFSFLGIIPLMGTLGL